MPTVTAHTEAVWAEVGAQVLEYCRDVMWPLIVKADRERAEQMAAATPESTAVQLFAEADPPQLVSVERFDAYVASLGSMAGQVDRENRTLLLRWHFLHGTPLSSLTWNSAEARVRAWEQVGGCLCGALVWGAIHIDAGLY